MPLPTTRRARFIYRQRLYARRRQQQHSRWHDYAKIGGKWKRVDTRKFPLLFDLQSPHGVKEIPVNPIAPILGPTFYRQLNNDGQPHWPHVTLFKFGSLQPYSTYAKYGWSRPLAALHIRRRRYCKPRHEGMNAEQRRVWGANWFYHENGYFPDLDPLERNPSESTWNGEDDTLWLEGDWPLINPYDVG